MSKKFISSDQLLSLMKERHSVRKFSNQHISMDVIKNCIQVASTAPSGANMQPWTFAVVASTAVKKQIRVAAEDVERRFYETKITPEWRNELTKLNVDTRKPFLTEAPYLICVFVQRYGLDTNGKRVKHYYPAESVGLATGFLIAALHQAGLSTLTYTPAPMDFIHKILFRPKNERPYMILPVGYPHSDYQPPALLKKNLSDILVEY